MLIDILTALIAVVSVSFVLGIVLALFIHFFGVKEDEKTKRIREALPGINCGACGFKGCSDYAEAIAAGSCEANLCVPGAKSCAIEIGSILGVKVEEPKDVVAFVGCDGSCDVTCDVAAYDGIETCKARAMIFGGPKACSFGCLGCGDCAAACVSEAISIVNGIARVDTSRCLGCGVCAGVCSKGIISMIPQESLAAVFCSSRARGADARKACKNACIGCKKCEKVCPSEAISVKNNLAVIDYEKCTACGACAEACPTGCLRRTSFPDIPEGFSY